MNATNGGGAPAQPPGDEVTVRMPIRHEHHKSITMADIAKAAGVSQGAISSLLNDRDYGIRVSDKTRDRVFKACRDLHYLPNDLRAVVRMYPENGELAVLGSSNIASVITDPFCARIIQGVMAASDDPSQPVTVARFDASADYAAHPDSLPQPVCLGTTSKFICVGRPNLSLFRAIIRRGYPVICVGYDVTHPGVTSILPDYAGASSMAVEYLLKLGHRSIAILSGPFGTTEPQIIELNRGVRMAYDHAGVPIEAQNIIYGDLTFQNGYNSVETLLHRQPRPTAILCLNDSAAAGVLARVQSNGLKVPADMTVLGCADDTFSECVHPALSTVHLPAQEIGAAAVHEVERRVAQKEAGLSETKRIILPVRLIERASAAAPRVR